MSKISKICEELNDHPKYNPLSNNPPKFDQFEETTDEEVLKIINSMGAKHVAATQYHHQCLKN